MRHFFKSLLCAFFALTCLFCSRAGLAADPLSADADLNYTYAGVIDLPAAAGALVYAGSGVGIDAATGMARALQAGDLFAGFAERRCDNRSGSAGDRDVRVRTRGRLYAAVSGLAATDTGAAVYMSNDATFTLTATGNSAAGWVAAYVSSGQGLIEFSADTAFDAAWMAAGYLPALDNSTDSAVALWSGTSGSALKAATTGDVTVPVQSGKTLVLDADVWEDLQVTPSAFDRPGSSDPSLVSHQPAGSGLSTYLYEFAKNNTACFSAQLSHSYNQGENINVHIHWTPGSRGNEESGNTVGWKVDYTWANIDGTFSAMQTADLSDASNGVDYAHQMTPAVALTGTGKNISSVLLCNVRRTDTGGDDTWASSSSGQLPMILSIDFHYPRDTLGSRSAGVK